jgi:hypothetical protein
MTTEARAQVPRRERGTSMNDNYLPSQQELHDMAESEHTDEFWQGWEAAERESKHSEGPTGCLDDGDDLSRALRQMDGDHFEQILEEELPDRTSVK